MKKKVLFICIHNSGRSQMAEAYLDLLGRDYFEVESAGFDPTEINPLVIEVMKEEGIDLSGRKAKDVFDLVRAGRFFWDRHHGLQQGQRERLPCVPRSHGKAVLGPGRPARLRRHI